MMLKSVILPSQSKVFLPSQISCRRTLTFSEEHRGANSFCVAILRTVRSLKSQSKKTCSILSSSMFSMMLLPNSRSQFFAMLHSCLNMFLLEDILSRNSQPSAMVIMGLQHSIIRFCSCSSDIISFSISSREFSLAVSHRVKSENRSTLRISSDFAFFSKSPRMCSMTEGCVIRLMPMMEFLSAYLRKTSLKLLNEKIRRSLPASSMQNRATSLHGSY